MFDCEIALENQNNTQLVIIVYSVDRQHWEIINIPELFLKKVLITTQLYFENIS